VESAASKVEVELEEDRPQGHQTTRLREHDLKPFSLFPSTGGPYILDHSQLALNRIRAVSNRLGYKAFERSSQGRTALLLPEFHALRRWVTLWLGSATRFMSHSQSFSGGPLRDLDCWNCSFSLRLCAFECRTQVVFGSSKTARRFCFRYQRCTNTRSVEGVCWIV